MNFTQTTPIAANADERPVDMTVMPTVEQDENGEPYAVIRIPLANVDKHLGVSRDKDTGKVTSVGFAVNIHPDFRISANGLPARNEALAKQAGEKYTKETPLSAVFSFGGRKGIWVNARLSADMTPRK